MTSTDRLGGGSSSRETSPFHSVHSDATLDDFYFGERIDSLRRHPPMNGTVPLPMEYSDESDECEKGGNSRRPRGNASERGSSRSTRQHHSSLGVSVLQRHHQQHLQQQSSVPGSRSRTSQSAYATGQTSGSSSKQAGNVLLSSNSLFAGDDANDGLADKESRDRGMSTKSSSAKQRRMKQNNGEDDEPNWMKRWAYSFRSPVVTTKQFSAAKTHRRQGSNVMEEYPHYSSLYDGIIPHEVVGEIAHDPPPPPPTSIDESSQVSQDEPSNSHGRLVSNSEASPLLGVNFAASFRNDNEATPISTQSNKDRNSLHRIQTSTSSSTDSKLSIHVAAAFLQDYEANRPPTFGGTVTLTEVTSYQIRLYHFKYSAFADACRVIAAIAWAGGCFMEGFQASEDDTKNRRLYWYMLTGLNVFPVAVFLFDIWMYRELRGSSEKFIRPRLARRASTAALLEKHNLRTERSEKLIQPLIFFCLLLVAENGTRLLTGSSHMVMYSSIFKPLVLFYVSAQARDAFAAVRSILKIVLRVLLMELFLILMFAAVACRLFQNYDRFRHLGAAWVSLFELSTTVVNPSIWMPIYKDSPSSALFFIFFIVSAVFYLHSLVLSVVFQTYIQAAAAIHERNASDREDSVHFAFLTLLKVDWLCDSDKEAETSTVVRVRTVRQMLRLLRPHYSSMKIDALVEIVDPSGQGTVDFATFRTKIRRALNASIRTSRNASNLAMSVELVAVAVAIVNFLYVILVSLAYEAQWFQAIQMEAGCLITLVASFELLIRLNPLRLPDFAPLTRFNTTFDGSAFVAATISCIGIAMYLSGYKFAMEYILIGRAIDMLRTMRFFHIFRDIVRRTSDVIPALNGPVILVVTTLHVFIYLGMALWGGAVVVGQHPHEIVMLYDLNNFNSYREGAVTMFQVIAVNDWYAIADVFRFASRNSNVYLVYAFFIVANLICVSIMLNVLTAFFVESFVTKLHEDKDAPPEATASMHRDRSNRAEADFRRLSTLSTSASQNDFDVPLDAGGEESSESDRIEFDVYERQGFDTIMQTVSGSVYHGDCARDICSYLEIYESLAPGREAVGYLVCDQQTLERFGNRRFKTRSIGFLDENKLHSVVTDMHAELLTLPPRANLQDRSLVRTFPHKREPGKALEISASLLRRHPALSLFVSRSSVSQPQHAVGTPPLSGVTRR